jgi:hypothetical protein
MEKPSLGMVLSNLRSSAIQGRLPIGATTAPVWPVLNPLASVNVSVNGGLYSVLLGNSAIQGMNAIDPSVFQQHGDARLRVWFSDGVNGFQQLTPDRPFASVPYALSAASCGYCTRLNKWIDALSILTFRSK